MIREDLVFVKQPMQSRKAVIEFIAAAAIKAGVLKDAAVFCDAVFRRENEISTSIGHSIAIPHVKTDAVHEADNAEGSTATAFEWDAETKDQVQVIFLIGVPEKNTDKLHLKAISEVSKKLINDEFREKLVACQNNREAFELLDSINQGIEK